MNKNNMVFGKNYSNIYDLIYKKKNYNSEVFYIENIINKFYKKKLKEKLILDLGCGTGIHSYKLEKIGYEVIGIDQSSHMLSIARRINKGNKNIFLKKDIKNFSYSNKFSVAISMFAVIGYLISNTDLTIVFQNTYKSLKKNGVFIFDCWNGNAVLNLKPKNKSLKIKNNNNFITRQTIQELDYNNNCLKIDFFINNNKTLSKNFKETHHMRYFFLPELETYLKNVGFRKVYFYNFLSLKKITFNNWNMHVVAIK